MTRVIRVMPWAVKNARARAQNAAAVAAVSSGRASVESVGLLWCAEEELVAATDGWTPARAVALLGSGVSGVRVARLTGYDPGWLAAQQRRLERRSRARTRG